MVRLIALLLAVLVLGIDQLSKRWALIALHEPGATLVLPGPVDLTLVFNRSNAFGLAPVFGELTRWGLTGLNVIVVLILSWVIVRRPMSTFGVIGLGFIVAGAAGNALDRIRFGAVVDFINAAKVGFVWVFNVADMSLDIGIGLLLLGILMARVRPDAGQSDKSGGTVRVK
jgi:signal peptidase II